MSDVLKEIPYKIERSEGMKPFWDGMNHGKLNSTRCSKCNELHYPPAPKLCPVCFGTDMSWEELSKSGQVTTFTEVNAPPAGFLTTYLLVSVELDGLGKEILGRFKGDNIAIGDRVSLNFEQIGDQAVFIFEKESS